MKALRTSLQTVLRAALPTLSRIDRFNQQYRNISEEEAIDYTLGAVFIELNIGQWEQLGAQNIQEADCDIVLHVVRQFLGDTFEHTPLTVLDLPGAVYVALQGRTLSDGTGRDIANALIRTDYREDNDHDGLEVDVLTFRTRITDYLSDTATLWTTTQAQLAVLEMDAPDVPVPLAPTSRRVINSDETYEVNISPSTVPFTLPDITHTDTDGSQTTLPAQVAMVCSPPEGLIRDNYSALLIYQGYGPASATDSDPITIKRVTIDPDDGSVVQEYSTNTWANYADGPWSLVPP